MSSGGGGGGSKRSHDGDSRPGSSSGENKPREDRDEDGVPSGKSNGTEKKKGRPKNGSSSSGDHDVETSATPASAMDSPPLSVTAEEINYLIYRYLQESGFVHSSFTFAHESLAGKLRPRNSASIPPGALVLFLQKGLQYVGMEEGLRRERMGHAVDDEGEVEDNGRPVKKAKAAEGDDHIASLGPDFSLLCPRALHTLKQKEPPIKLRVPPASAAAVIKAKMEMDEKIVRERALLYGSGKGKKGRRQQHHQQVFYEEEEGVEEVVDEEYPVQHKKKGKAKSKKAAAPLEDDDEEETLRQVSNNASSMTPKKRKKKKKVVDTEEEEVQSVQQQEEEETPKKSSGKEEKQKASADAGKSNIPMEVDEVDSKQQQQQRTKMTQQRQQQMSLQQQQQQMNLIKEKALQQSQQDVRQQQPQQQLQEQNHQQQQQEYQREMEKQRQFAQRIQEVQRMQEPHAQQQKQQQRQTSHSQIYNSNSRGNVAGALGPPPAAATAAEAAVHSNERSLPQSYLTMDAGVEAAALARQHAELQAALVQRQQAVLTGRGGVISGGSAQQQHQVLQGEDSARANAIAALMASAASSGNLPEGGLSGSGNVNALPNAISSNSVGHVINGKTTPSVSHGLGPPVAALPGDKRGGSEDQDMRRNNLPLTTVQSVTEIEAEDRMKSIHPIEVMELSEHTSEVFMCAWNPRFTNLIATGSGDASARIWVINPPNATGGCQQSILLPHGINSADKKNKDVTTLEWSPSGELLATGSYDGVARVWSRSGELRQTLKGHRGPIFSLKWNKRGNYLLSGSYDKTTIVWDVSVDKGFVKQQFSYHFAPALDVDWKDDLTFASCSTDKTVQICRVGSARALKTFSGHTDEVNAVKWDPSGTLLASCSDDCTAKVWDVNSSSTLPKWDFKSHQQEIYTVKWSPTGPGSKNPTKPLMLATASFDGSVRLWNIDDGTCARILSRHRESVYSVAFSPSGDYLASGSLAGQLYIWNVRDGVIIKSFKGRGDIFEVAWNIEESRVAACFSSNVVSVIDFKRP
ncbi:hypothetical protein HJC23_008329 [Cyclotella cryptica]|uniref:Uncharacterized protein n=1 Tax=Cyclotella cryptica TaxID=29204 RepID=A0ABD3Q5L1_9STRA